MSKRYLIALAVVAGNTALNWLLSHWFAPTNLAMVYLLGVVLTAAQFGRGPSALCALGSVAAFDFFFVPPVFTFRFGDTQYLLAAIVLLIVGLVISTLAIHLRIQAQAADRATLAAREERLRNSLLASISHDLRTPLAVIVGSASHLMESADHISRDEQRRQLNRIYEEAQYVSRVVSDLLDITRLQAGPVQLDKQWYPLEELIGAALERTKTQLASHTVTVAIPQQLPMLLVDGVLLEKLLINLLENAGKYTPAGTCIDVSAEQRGDVVTIEIADRGPGLGTQDTEKLFEKFHRGTSEGSVMGAGLGLTICRAIAQAHGGDVRAFNRIGGGAVFAVDLPFVEPPTIVAEEMPT